MQKSTWIALVALFLSIFSLIATQYQSYSADRVAMKARLIEQMDRFYREAETATLRMKAETDPATSLIINGIWETRKDILINDLQWLANQFPDDIESSEYSALSGILVSDGRVEVAVGFAETALALASSDRTRMGAKQRLERVLFPLSEVQDVKRARNLLEEAAIWHSQTKRVSDVLQSGFVYARWADLEATTGSTEGAIKQTVNAIDIYERISHLKPAQQQILLLKENLVRLKRGEPIAPL